MDRLVPLGDQVALAYFRQEETALRFASRVRGVGWSWVVDVVQAYASVAIFFSLEQITFGEVGRRLQALDASPAENQSRPPGTLHVIPCCYEFSPDLERIAQY